MPKKIEVVSADGAMIDLGGGVQFPVELIKQRSPINTAPKGMLLWGEQEQFVLKQGGQDVSYSLTFRVVREGITEAEKGKIVAAATLQQVKADKRQEKLDAAQRHNVQAQVERATEGVVTGMKLLSEIGPQLRASAAIAKAVGVDKLD